MMQNAGSQLATADAALGASGVPMRVFGMHIISAGANGSVTLRNGTSASDTAYITETGVTGTGQSFSYGPQGVIFPSGCYIDVDGSTTSVLVTYTYA